MNDQIFNSLIRFEVLEKLEGELYNLPFTINNDSKIFDGHFPNQPILPGVVMIELTKRAVEISLAKKLKLDSAGNFKFLKMIDPNVIKVAAISFKIITKNDGWSVKAQIKYKDEICFKADAFYKRK